MSDAPTTRPSLLLRMRDARDHEAWHTFVELYAPLVYRFARKRGLQDADAAADDRRVGEAKNGPALLGRLRGHELLEPLDLLGVDEDLVGRVGRVAEFGGPETD